MISCCIVPLGIIILCYVAVWMAIRAVRNPTYRTQSKLFFLIRGQSSLAYLSPPGCSTTEGIWINTKGWKGSQQNDCCHDYCLCNLLGTIHFFCLLWDCLPWLCFSPTGSSLACILCKKRHHLQPRYLCLYEPTGNKWTFTFANDSTFYISLYFFLLVYILIYANMPCLVVPFMHHAAIWKEGWWWLWSVLYLQNRSLLCGTCINIFWLVANVKDFRTLDLIF